MRGSSHPMGTARAAASPQLPAVGIRAAEDSIFPLRLPPNALKSSGWLR